MNLKRLLVGWYRLMALGTVAVMGPWNAKTAEAPAWELEHWETKTPVSLNDFHGQIVVLDFFAYWCLPCNRSAQILEKDVQQYYHARGGNAYGVPVQVVSINIEKDFPQRTAQFISRNKPSFVVQDRDGMTLKAYEGEGIPFLVILDGHSSSGFTILHRQAGLDSVEEIRRILDSVGAPRDLPSKNLSQNDTLSSAGSSDLVLNPTPSLLEQEALPKAPVLPPVPFEDPVSSPLPSNRSPLLEHQFETAFEYLGASDTWLTQTDFRYSLGVGSSQRYQVGVDYATIRQELRSSDFLILPTTVNERRRGMSLDGRWRVADHWTVLASTVGYEGFTDYRSAWLHEYYRQRYGFIGYNEVQPRGFQLGTGVRWEYQPGISFLQIDLGFAENRIAPSAEPEVFGGLIVGEDHLKTPSLKLSAENVLTKRLRSLLEVRVSETTERDPRYSAQGTLKWAVGERWVARISAGGTREEPELKAVYGGATLEFEMNEAWAIRWTARGYHDTGEVENSLSSSPPGLETLQAGMGLRYQTERSHFQVYAAPVWSRYESATDEVAFFEDLYSDRNWFLAQISFGFRF